MFAIFSQAFQKMRQMTLWNCKPRVVVHHLAASAACTILSCPSNPLAAVAYEWSVEIEAAVPCCKT